MTRLEEIEDRVDEERLAWTCLTILGMLFPAQFDELVSRFYMDMNIYQQAHWLSCSKGNVLKLSKKADRNLKIIAAHVTKAMEKTNS